MRREAYLVIFLMMLCATSVQAQMPVSPLTFTATKIVQFAPSLPSGGVRKGSCWTESIAVPRAGAWRCAVGNSDQRSVFHGPGESQAARLRRRPRAQADGFILKLTKPLPKVSHQDRKSEPWIFQLADNSICEAMTGTLPAVNGEPARWSCAIHIRDQVRPRGCGDGADAGENLAGRQISGERGQPRSAEGEKIRPEKSR